MSKLYVDEIHPKTAGGNTTIIRPSGIVQVKYTQFTGTNSIGYTAATDKKLTDLSVNITPKFSDSIIKIEAFVTGENSNATANYNMAWHFYRDNTVLRGSPAGNRTVGIHMGSNMTINTGDTGSTPENACYMYFDSPNTTSEITYSVGLISSYSATWHLNKTVTDSNGGAYERGVSSICVTEIQAT